MRKAIGGALCVSLLFGGAAYAQTKKSDTVTIERYKLEQLMRELNQTRKELEQTRAELDAATAKARPADKQKPVAGFMSVEMKGRLSSVRPNALHVLDEEDNLFILKVDPATKAMRGGEPIAVQNLPEGATVRATFEVIGEDHLAREVSVMGEADAGAGGLPKG